MCETEVFDTDSIEAKCLQMCPLSECIKREKERLIHILETDPNSKPTRSKDRIADRSRMIKSYYRSAAGQELTKPELLRPPSILLKTVDYIFNDVIYDNRVPKTSLYNFIDDRLRSVKQDGIIQRLSPDTWFQLLTPIIRFYVYSAYTFCEEPLPNFDQKLNKDQLVDGLVRFIKLYEDHPYERHSSAYAEMEAFYLIVNYDKVEAINRAVSLNIQDEVFQKTLKFILKYFTHNYCAVFRYLPSLPLLPACLFVALHLNKIRKRTLEIMSTAYSSKNTKYAVSKLEKNLLFNSANEAIKECRFYGISVNSNNQIEFLKRTFTAEEVPPRRLKPLDEKLSQISLSRLLLNKNS